MARPSHSDHVLQQLNNQREWGFLCDCLIAIGDIYFRAHKAVLAACSSYFRMMFIRDQQGAGRLDLSNMQISAECFDLILQLMYLGRIVVGSYEFEELKASMVYLQMYYIPDSLEDLRDIRSSNLTPSSSSSLSSSSSSSSTGVCGGKMMFGVRMYEQQRPAPPEGEQTAKAVSGGAGGRPFAPAADSRPGGSDDVTTTPLIVAPPAADVTAEQPCDLRKRSGGRSSALKERPRFGRTYTCDDCGFVFSCEKLLIEHILTCTNRKAFHPPRGNMEGDNDSSKAESSASESTEEHRVVCKGEDYWPETKGDSDLSVRLVAAETAGEPGSTQNIKTEPEESVFPEIEMIQVGEIRDCKPRSGATTYKDSLREHMGSDQEPEPGVSGLESSGELLEGHLSSSNDEGILTKRRKVKDEKQEADRAPCELCGTLLTEEDKSGHYLSNHMGHICACGRCGQVLIKGRQLQEHAERCGESHGGDSDSHGDDDVSLLGEPQGMEEGLLEVTDLACPHCGLPFQNETLALEHALSCHDQDLYRPVALDEGGEPDHRRKHFCSICGKGFYQRCHLREHYTVHTKEKQFTCQTCGKQFLRERQLRLHTDMHKGMARYVCPLCDQGTFLKHDHVRHMISHLSAGETICQVCFQIFPGGEQLEKHMDVHLYICGVCGEKFRLRKDMRSHYNSKHTKRL
ncbi:zinc finger and BTB domain-containing protein 1 [Oryzias latipes]|uniref:Zinc finger and BTB domain containing 1 n=1 Tax=Oryzias latipes TaxID=8090 RepID=H2MLW0_ORYLA|nr:zinc finger and BTB domain-containing protein 1 [Oryzias latipes]XP_011490027.1 zinc finger and BTB domain-containing protein 1 [Oryzias latipes]XP_011490029.1 zinc finger and BTB domain-containing protein 1 [Oryzias latipes]